MAAAGRLVAVVTGANQGIGLEISRILARAVVHTHPRGASHANTYRFHVVMTARDMSKGLAAAEDVRSNAHPPRAGHASHAPAPAHGDAAHTHTHDDVHVTVLQLDITKDDSVAAFTAELARLFPRVHVLINNAGFAHKGDIFGAAEARETINVNVRGCMRVTHALTHAHAHTHTPTHSHTGADTSAEATSGRVPLLRAEAGDDPDFPPRIINVCSQAGRLGQVSPTLQSRFQDPDASPESVCALMDEFVAAVEKGSHRAEGWPQSMYGVSKLGEIAYTYVLARRLAPLGIVVNAVCPGYCSTSMSSFRGVRSASEGAHTITQLATRKGAVHELTGGFWVDGKLMAW